MNEEQRALLQDALATVEAADACIEAYMQRLWRLMQSGVPITAELASVRSIIEKSEAIVAQVRSYVED